MSEPTTPHDRHASTCPNEANHTPIPDGYTPLTAHTIRTHRQTRCPGCGKWVIWVPKSPFVQKEKGDAR